MWLGSEEDLAGFLGCTNEFNPNLKFTCEKSGKELNLLDVIEKIRSDKLITNLFWKPVDGHQYLHYKFCNAFP